MSWIDAELILDAPRLQKERDLLTRAYLLAGKSALTDTVRESEQDLERETQRAVPGRLWRAWKSKVEPKGARLARDPAAFIFLNGGLRTRGAMTFFTQSGRLASSTAAGWTAIPLPAAGARGKARDLTPAQWEQRTGLKLRPVFRPGQAGLLVADAAVLSGKKQIARANSARRAAAGRGNATIPIFILLPPRTFEGRFSIESILAPAGDRLRQRFEAHAALIRDVRARA